MQITPINPELLGHLTPSLASLADIYEHYVPH